MIINRCKVCGQECKNMVDETQRQLVKYCSKACRLQRHKRNNVLKAHVNENLGYRTSKHAFLKNS